MHVENFVFSFQNSQPKIKILGWECASYPNFTASPKNLPLFSIEVGVEDTEGKENDGWFQSAVDSWLIMKNYNYNK